MLEILFQKAHSDSTLCVFVDDNLNILADNGSQELCQKNPIVKALLKGASDFKGEHLAVKVLSFLDVDKISNVIFIGSGNLSEITEHKIQELGAVLFHTLATNCIAKAHVSLNSDIEKMPLAGLNANLAYGALLASYRFDQYKTQEKKATTINICFTQAETESAETFKDLESLAKGIFFARDCVNLPPNHLHPESYANKIAAEFDGMNNIAVSILKEQDMHKLNMGALLGVGQGSAQESQLVIVEYTGGKDGERPVALVGKGVTFDTGGISIKPASNMDQMKYDMAGSAAVVGTIKALALRNAKVNVVGVVGLVENMPGHNAQRPGDIVKTMSGKTIEILNTDAEGRLVLADALWYAQSKFHPSITIDLATLTGAIIVALGSSYAGCFSKDQDLVKDLTEAGKSTGEQIWHMPLHKDYQDMLKSHIADIANISKSGRGDAGSSTAAQFLSYFVEKDTRWAHLDIAGVAYNKSTKPLCIEGGNGFGVALLNSFIAKFCESK